MFAEDVSEDFSDLTFTGFYSISGYLRNLRGRLLSSEKFSEVFTLWVFTLKPFPGLQDRLSIIREPDIRTARCRTELPPKKLNLTRNMV